MSPRPPLTGLAKRLNAICTRHISNCRKERGVSYAEATRCITFDSPWSDAYWAEINKAKADAAAKAEGRP